MTGVDNFLIAVASLILCITFAFPTMAFYIALGLVFYGNYVSIFFGLIFAFYSAKWVESVHQKLRDKNERD